MTTKKDKIYTMDKAFTFERQKGYLPMGYITVEDEIKALCKKNRIVVQSIVKFDGYRVYGTKTRSHKECLDLQKIINK